MKEIQIMSNKLLFDNGHGINTPGKHSPDKRLMEWEYARRVVKCVVCRLKLFGFDAEILVPENEDISLSERVRRVNNWCDKLGKDNVLLTSVHVNAAGADGKWHEAGGWSCFTTRGDTKSDLLAEYYYESAQKNLTEYISRFEYYKSILTYGSKQKPIRTDRSDGDCDFESNFYILANTKCPAVLTENLFQDNINDVNYLLSNSGFESIVQLHVDGIINFLKQEK
jgi:N-acetylmuramoyl-L-alanine amidase